MVPQYDASAVRSGSDKSCQTMKINQFIKIESYMSFEIFGFRHIYEIFILNFFYSCYFEFFQGRQI